MIVDAMSSNATPALIQEFFQELNAGKSIAEVLIGNGDAWFASIIIEAIDSYPTLPENFQRQEEGLDATGRGVLSAYTADKFATFLALKKAYDEGRYSADASIFPRMMEFAMDGANVEALYQALPEESKPMKLFNMMRREPGDEFSTKRKEAILNFQRNHQDDDWQNIPEIDI